MVSGFPPEGFGQTALMQYSVDALADPSVEGLGHSVVLRRIVRGSAPLGALLFEELGELLA